MIYLLLIYHKMCTKIIFSATFPIWYFITTVMMISVSPIIIQNKYNTDVCYDGIYIDLSMYKLFIIQLILYTFIASVQIMFYFLVRCSITTEKTWWIFVGNIISFMSISLLTGFYLNFVLTNTHNCLNDLKISDFNVYMYFILTFTLSCIFELLLILKLLGYSSLE
jgi:hypothetical protein